MVGNIEDTITKSPTVGQEKLGIGEWNLTHSPQLALLKGEQPQKKFAADCYLFDVSIAVVSFNTRNTLRESLQSIDRETDRLRFEVLVVDNGSSDGSPAMVSKSFPMYGYP